MFSSKAIARATPRALRQGTIRNTAHRNVRFNSTSPSTGVQSGVASGLVGGVVGGGVVFLAGYAYYHFSGVKSLVNAATSTQDRFNQMAKSMKENAPEPNEVLKAFRSMVTSYAAFVPGAKSYVDSVFNKLDKVEQKHRGKVDAIVGKAYAELREVSSEGGLTTETAAQAWGILQKYMKQLGELAADGAEDLLNEHPELKEKLGANLDRLKTMANNYGPEAKKELDRTYDQVKDLLAGGLGADRVEKVRRLLEERVEKMKQVGDEAWKKGLEQAKPYLDKNAELKQLIEANTDALKQGNFADLYEKIKSGNMDELKRFADQAKETARQSGLEVGKSLEPYLKRIPGGDKIVPKLIQLHEVAKKHGDEAEKIAKDTYQVIAEVLSKKVDDVEKLADKVEKDAKEKSKKQY